MDSSTNTASPANAWSLAGDVITRYKNLPYRVYGEAAALAAAGGVIGHQMVSRLSGTANSDFTYVNPWPMALGLAAILASAKLPEKINQNPVFRLGMLGTLAATALAPSYYGLIKPENDLKNDRAAIVEQIRKDESLGVGARKDIETRGASGFKAASAAIVTGTVDMGEFGGVCREVLVGSNIRGNYAENFLLCSGGKTVRFNMTNALPEITALGKKAFHQKGICDTFSVKLSPTQPAALYAKCQSGTYSLWAATSPSFN